MLILLSWYAVVIFIEGRGDGYIIVCPMCIFTCHGKDILIILWKVRTEHEKPN